eukprot:3499425-Alexandrium_andersonii.AAC.1
MKAGSLESVADFLMRLGLRHPTEPTVRDVALALLFQSEGFEGALAMPPEGKLAIIKAMKQGIKARVRLAPPLAQWVAHLPRYPEELRSLSADIFKSAFGDQSPAACPISEVQMGQLRMTTRMRTMKRGVVLDLASAHAAP